MIVPFSLTDSLLSEYLGSLMKMDLVVSISENLLLRCGIIAHSHTPHLVNFFSFEFNMLALFAFDLYDKDSSGIIDGNEVQLMLKEIYGVNYSQNVHATRIGEKIESMTLRDINKDVFREFTRRHPALLFPAFELQRVFQKHCLGEAFWKKLTQKRIDLSDGKFLSVGEIIEMLNHEPIQRKVDREGGLQNVNVEALIAAQHAHGSLRKISTADRDDEPSTHNQSLHVMASTITMASHAKRRTSAAKIVPVSSNSTDPLIDISSQGSCSFRLDVNYP